MSEEKGVTRRSLLLTFGIALNGIIAAAIAMPVIGYLLSPIKKKAAYNQWITLGSLSQFPEGQTRLADFVNPFTRPQDGETGKTPCWVRRVSGDKFQVFAVNCAHLGCPVRWFPQSELFMCPCHGGV
jgi:Rieske Fe-S protein